MIESLERRSWVGTTIVYYQGYFNSRIEGALEQTDIGRLRKERAAARRDDQLTHALEVEDTLIQEETKRSAIANGADVGTGDGGDAREEVDAKQKRGVDPTVEIDDGDVLRPAPQSGPRRSDIALTRLRPRLAAMIGWDLMMILNLRPIGELTFVYHLHIAILPRFTLEAPPVLPLQSPRGTN